MTRLAQTQDVFWRLISAPEGVAAGLAALPDRERALPFGLDGWLRDDERLSAIERLDVYANMYFFRLLDCLAEDFPAIHAVVGHERFHALVRDYLTIHPSEHPSVRMLGRALGDLLETHPLSAEVSVSARPRTVRMGPARGLRCGRRRAARGRGLAAARA